jgi:V8-like Glu-specific endopeptidase
VLKLGIAMEDPKRFLISAFPSKINSFGSAELGELIGDELYQLVQKRTSTYTIESLLADISQREGLEAVLGSEIQPLLEVYGLRFTGLRLARFTGEAVEAIREKLGTKAVRVRTYELERELEELDRQHRLKSITNTYEYNELEKQLELDYALKDGERDLLRKRWEANTGHQLTLEALNRETEERRARFAADQSLLKDHRGAELDTESHVDEMLRITRTRELSGLRHGAAVAGAEGDIEVIKVGIRVKVLKIEDDYKRYQDAEDLRLAEEARKRALEALIAMQEFEQKKAENEQRLKNDAATHAQQLEERRLLARAGALRGLSRDEIMGVVQDGGIASSLLRLAEIQQGKELAFAPSPYNQSHSGLPQQIAPNNPFAHYGMPFQQGAAGFGIPAAPHGYQAMPAMENPGGMSDDRRLQIASERASECVGVIVAEGGGQTQPFGTGWMLGARILATNAHVAEAAQQLANNDKATWVIFGGKHGNSRVKINQIVLHPKYGDPGSGPGGNRAAVSAYDVAIMILDRDMPQWLNIAGPEKILSLSQGQRIAYMGFPMEGIAGGGVNIASPSPVFKTGSISAVTDWWLGQCPPQQRMLIQHDLGVAGGASGSPLMDVDGCVIGLISAGSHAAIRDPQSGLSGRIPSGVLLNYAQRVDLLGDLLIQ